MPLAREFKQQTIILNNSSKRLLTMLYDAIKVQDLEINYFKPLEEFSLANKEFLLPAIDFSIDFVGDNIFEEYRLRLYTALKNSGYDPIDTYRLPLKSPFTIAWEVLLRLVALMFSTHGECQKWFDIYNNFVNEISQSDLLLLQPQFLFFGSRAPSALSQLLMDKNLENKLATTVNRVDMMHKKLAPLSPEERERVEQFRAIEGARALRDLFKLAPQLFSPEGTNLCSQAFGL